MLIITKVETINVDKQYGEMMHTIEHCKAFNLPFEANGELFDPVVITEYVKGQRYVDQQRGIDVVIGCTEEAKEALLMQYRLWKYNEEKLNRGLEKLTSEKDAIETHHKIVSVDLKKAYYKIEQTIGAPFLTRLKWLFTGVKI